MKSRFFALFLLILLGACASTPPFGSGPMAVAPMSELPPPTGVDLVQANAPYLIGPNDKLTVTVFGVEELSGDVQADSSGRVAVPLIGAVDAAGLTPAQLGETIADRLRGRYMRDPHVTVNLREASSQTFTVDGEVREPGIYPVVGNLSLMRAVATAKGLTEYSKLDDVVVFRTVNGKPMAALYNLGAIRRGNYADPRVYANDIVVVGNSNARRLFRDAMTLAPLLTTPLILLLQ